MARPDGVPRAYPDVIFLSEEFKYNQFPDELLVFDVKYLKQAKSAQKYNEKGSPKYWKQQIACYVRAEHRSTHEANAVFAIKRRVTDNKENVLVLSKTLGGVQLSVCGVHFSSKYVGQCKNNSDKGKKVLAEKLKWSAGLGVDMLRFMNAVVTNDSTSIYRNTISGDARPVVGDQSTEDGYYSDHPWVFVTVGKKISTSSDVKTKLDDL
ncbi:hypothetical protein DB30_03887 [Enhygromyxa salina]|uniref:Uncharacterized protein n=1 Tax=Enhygromyxa salina TaxID=215803 RepID=A0A0C2D873_9BACT|nr:hypothetical protein DB30_03887 [Enhygromyxa salina]